MHIILFTGNSKINETFKKDFSFLKMHFKHLGYSFSFELSTYTHTCVWEREWVSMLVEYPLFHREDQILDGNSVSAVEFGYK